MSVTRLNQPQQAVVSAAGVATLTFVPPPLGEQNTGTITVWNSPHGVVWSVNLNSTTITTTVGASPVGNIQCQDSDTLTLTASGLQPGFIVQATYVGIQEDKSTGAVVAPDGSSIVAIGANAARVALGPTTFLTNSVSGNNFTVNLLPTDRRVVVLLYQPISGFSPITVSLTGAQSSINWAGLLPKNQITGGVGNGGMLEVPIFGSVDSSANLLLQPFAPAVSATLVVLAFSDEYTPGNPNNPISVVDSLGAYTGQRVTIASGGGNTTLLSAPPANFVNDIAVAGVWSNGVPTAASSAILFDPVSLAAIAGGFCANGVPFIDRRSFSNFKTGTSLTAGGQTSGVTMVYEVWARVIPVLE